MSPDSPAALSPAGAARRDAMLDELLGAMSDLHQRRRRRRQVAAASVLMLAAATLTWAMQPRPTRGPGPETAAGGSSAAAIDAAATASRAMRLTFVATDPSTVDRFQARPAPAIQRVDDETLLGTLAQINRPAGLIVTERQVRLTAAVTDLELSIPGSG